MCHIIRPYMCQRARSPLVTVRPILLADKSHIGNPPGKKPVFITSDRAIMIRVTAVLLVIIPFIAVWRRSAKYLGGSLVHSTENISDTLINP